MLNANAFANATATIVAATYIICRLIAWIMPSYLYQVGQSWFHTIQMETGQSAAALSFGSFLLGLVSATVVAWLVSYAMIGLYNRWSK